MNANDTAQIHDLIRQHYCTLEPGDPPTGDLNEEILSDGSREIARTYRLGSLVVMWYVDAGVLQFFDLHANLLHSVACPLVEVVTVGQGRVAG